MNFRRHIQNDQLSRRIEGWLKKKMALKIVLRFGSALVSLLGGGLILTATYFVAYAVIWFGFNFGVSAFCQLVFSTPLHLSSKWIQRICLSFLILLFIEYFRVNLDYWDSYSVKSRVPASLVWFAGVFGAIVTLLANLDASVKIISNLFLSGPCAVVFGIKMFGRGLRGTHFDIEGCAAALKVLTERKTRISLSELVGLLPTRNPINVLFQLQDIDGVLLLKNEPIGIILSEGLRDELMRLIDFTESDDDSELEQERMSYEADDHYGILGVTPPFSSDEIKFAYRRCMKDCHPDRFTGAPPELRLWAEERAKTVNAAYETLLKELGGK